MPQHSKIIAAAIACLIFSAPAFSSAREMEDYPSVKVRALDKITARTQTIEIPVGETTQFESVFIKARACRKASPVEAPETAAFLEIWEFPLNERAENREKPQWIYSGWMFASSPGLASMDHTIYDVSVVDCAGATPEEKNAPAQAEEKSLKDSITTEIAPADIPEEVAPEEVPE